MEIESEQTAASQVREAYAEFSRALGRWGSRLELEEIGHLTAIGQGVAWASGLPGVRDEELVRLGRQDETLGLALELSREALGIVILGAAGKLKAGDRVRRTGRVLDVAVGEGLLGRVVDSLGRPLDGLGPIDGDRRPVERAAPTMLQRAPVTVPLQTGTKAVDALIPLGRGQRELIVGDRQTGKTTIALDTMLNQSGTGVTCVYCAIGQRSASVAKVVAELRKQGALDRCIVVSAASEDVAGLRFVAPYSATTIAEYFRDRGEDALVIFDDLTRHARSYRELSLLLRRPPGREAYPGDIFYVHSRLLERSTQLSEEEGGGSLTALPIVETQAQDISAYIPTNLISITDGQIYLSPGKFQKGVLPAVDVGRSVSRVGGKAQLPAYRAVASDLRLAYSQFEELESFSRFGTQLDEETRHQLARGRRVREVLKQDAHSPVDVPEQIAALLAVTEGLFDDLPIQEVRAGEQRLRALVRQSHPEVCDRIAGGAELDQECREALLGAARTVLLEEPTGS